MTRSPKDHQKNWLGRDGEKHVELCLDVGQSSENPALFSVNMYFRANVTRYPL